MVENTAKKGLFRLEEVIKLMEQMIEKIKETLLKVYSKDLIEIIFRLPNTKRQFLINAGLGTLKTVGKYVDKTKQV